MSVVLDLPRDPQAEERPLKSQYLTSLKIVERLHRLLLDVVKMSSSELGAPTSTACRRSCSIISATAS